MILSEYCNCIVSYVEDCDLNYVFLECFYLGVPLIHNSPMLKNYGYYYPRLNVTRGAEQIVNVVNNHNREEYIKDILTYSSSLLHLALITQLANLVAVFLKTKGTIINFPSFVWHRVTPVTKGTRYSLVVWHNGPKLK